MTTTASSSPPVSTATGRVRPLIFFPASYPLLAVGTVSAARTVWCGGKSAGRARQAIPPRTR